MDLSQISPGRAVGSIDDPLADPYDVPTYGFGFRTANYQRREDADALGHVNGKDSIFLSTIIKLRNINFFLFHTGLYSYLDDIGERHSVRYAAGANTGYEVSNAVPDTPSLVRYNAPLYKTNRNVRGRIAYERGPGGQYKFIASGPDQRRSESTGADGITRGSYSYLDDKGVQRTVQYIAGAGIGYRIVQSTTGVNTHLAPRPAIPEFGISPQSNDISDDDGTGFKTAESGSIVPPTGRKPKPIQGNSNNYAGDGLAGNSNGLRSNQNHVSSNELPNSTGFGNTSLGPIRGGTANSFDSTRRQSNTPYRGTNRFNNNAGAGNSNSQGSSNAKPNQQHGNNRDDNHAAGPTYVSNEYDDDDVVNHDRNTDWKNRGRDSTVVKNVGHSYVGLPPGTAVRAHVQSIDLLPLDGRRPPSPGDALRRDEQRALSNL